MGKRVAQPGRSEKGSGKTAPSFEDDRQAEATRAAAQAVAQMLESYLEFNADRMVRTLLMTDLEWIAIAAITGWVKARADQAIAVKRDVNETIRETPRLVMP